MAFAGGRSLASNSPPLSPRTTERIEEIFASNLEDAFDENTSAGMAMLWAGTAIEVPASASASSASAASVSSASASASSASASASAAAASACAGVFEVPTSSSPAAPLKSPAPGIDYERWAMNAKAESRDPAAKGSKRASKRRKSVSAAVKAVADTMAEGLGLPPAGIDHARWAMKAKFVVDVMSPPSTELMASYNVTLTARWLNKQPLREALIVPVRDACVRRSPALSAVKIGDIVPTINGVAVDPKLACATYVRSPDEVTRVVLTLPVVAALPHGALPLPPGVAAVFEVDIGSEGASALVHTQTHLHHWQIRKSLQDALVIPVLEEYLARSWQLRVRAILQHVVVFVDGRATDAKSHSASSFCKPNGEVVRIRLEIARDALPASALNVATFHVVIEDEHRNEAMGIETTLNRRWLGRPLLQAIVAPAMKECYRQGQNQMRYPMSHIGINVDGKETDGHSASYIFVKDCSKPVEVHLTLPRGALLDVDREDSDVQNVGLGSRSDVHNGDYYSQHSLTTKWYY